MSASPAQPKSSNQPAPTITIAPDSLVEKPSTREKRFIILGTVLGTSTLLLLGLCLWFYGRLRQANLISTRRGVFALFSASTSERTSRAPTLIPFTEKGGETERSLKGSVIRRCFSFRTARSSDTRSFEIASSSDVESAVSGVPDSQEEFRTTLPRYSQPDCSSDPPSYPSSEVEIM